MCNKPSSPAIALAVLLMSLHSLGATAASFDGSASLLCAALDVIGCDNGPGCWEGQARDFELPQFVLVDFKNKLVRAKDDSENPAVSPILNLEKTDQQIIIQGVENGHGWSGMIDRESGTISFAAAGPEASFMLFGSCTTLQ